ncbi:MAG: class B sortase [Stomatobaculum sp.]|nr:class B sortase [Stomatobaculum sp.]
MRISTEGNNRKKIPLWAGILVIVIIAVLAGIWLAGLLKKPEPPVETEATTTAPVIIETEPPEPETEPPMPVDPLALREIDWEGLEKRNSDVVGWIFVPGTVIDYPVMWKQADNTYYNRRDIDRTQGSYRGVYMDGDDSPNMTSLHILLYGHHMKDQTMFTPVCDFKDEKFFKEHDRLYFYTPEHCFILKPIACLYADGIAERRRIFFRDREDFDHYVEWMSYGCDYREIPEEGINQLFTLVTCSYELGHDSRTLLQCCEVLPDGTPVERAEVKELELPGWAEELRENTEKMLLKAREEEQNRH